jgi:hypothetical protein
VVRATSGRPPEAADVCALTDPAGQPPDVRLASVVVLVLHPQGTPRDDDDPIRISLSCIMSLCPRRIAVFRGRSFIEARGSGSARTRSACRRLPEDGPSSRPEDALDPLATVSHRRLPGRPFIEATLSSSTRPRAPTRSFGTAFIEAALLSPGSGFSRHRRRLYGMALHRGSSSPVTYGRLVAIAVIRDGPSSRGDEVQVSGDV